ncbi:uncharacterized protein LOC129804026 [Phlebotomus papatasi]|uniref:uncharacterized protein LOC129804026 n=1 Tax=Phlebotomus papatasi TaxID=29031 RepID=UPI0024838457|nr:uncharacterized protein LOC129804026 [Phlebotomus papatasi]
MDRSVDSIGSCSLDVDAESTDFSDTSGSFNLLTPSSAKDFPREFITRIHERSQCPPPQSVIRQQTSIVLDPQSGRVNTILSGQPPPPTIVESPPPGAVVEETKKPSYLNLACCVNGYSHLTTYNSKLRQDINKSREVSPIRPITYTKTNASGKLFVPPPVATIRLSGDPMESHRSVMSPEKRLFTQHIMAMETTNGTGDDTTDNVRHFRTTKYIHTMSTTTTSKKIVEENGVQQHQQQQQYKAGSIAPHVEKLFGPGALAQGFHTNRRSMENGQTTCVLTEKSMNSRNFFSPVVKMTRKEAIANGGQETTTTTPYSENGKGLENLKDLKDALPVLRYLSPEFKKQLPICASPRRYVPPTREDHSGQMTNGVRHHATETNNVTTVKITSPTKILQSAVIDKEVVSSPVRLVEKIGDTQADTKEDKAAKEVGDLKTKDGNYFLDILATERGRILSLADKVDSYMEQIKDKDVSEEVVGYLRAASGKARLLAAQKMKQFEGLCHSNLTQSPDEKFQTTAEDLQGFWDMVMLQVNHVDSLFEEIEVLKVNNWKKKSVEAKAPPQGAKLTKRPLATKGSTSSSTSSGPAKKSAAATLAAQKREAQRKQLMEMKKKSRMAMNQAQNGDNAAGNDDSVSTKSNGVDKV